MKVQRTLQSWKSIDASKGVAIDKLSLIRDPEDKNDIGCIAAFAAQVGLPQSPLPPPPVDRDGNQTAPLWVRRNGNLELRITSLAGAPIPSGVVPRQFLAILCTDVIVRQNEPDYWVVDLGRNLSDLMTRRLGLKPTGGPRGTITRFKEGAWQLMTSAVSVIQYPNTPAEKKIFKAATIAEEIELWDNFKRPTMDTLWKSHATLNKKFADGILQSAVPFSWTILSGLRDSALGMDLYLCFLRRWWSIERHRKRQPQFIAYDDLKYWFGSQYADDKSGRQGFQRKANQQIENIVKLTGGEARITIKQVIRGEGGKLVKGIWLHHSPRAIIRPEQMRQLS